MVVQSFSRTAASPKRQALSARTRNPAPRRRLLQGGEKRCLKGGATEQTSGAERGGVGEGGVKAEVGAVKEGGEFGEAEGETFGRGGA